MSKILISTESRFPVNKKLMRETVENFLEQQKVKADIEVSILVVGDRKMRELNNKYRKLDHTTPVLTFAQEEGKAFVSPPDKILRIGDIVISYPQTVLMARDENKMVDQKITDLVSHGLSNLFGLTSL
ncbi:MAG: rRNA maturation RNase YbeY [Candidatus Gottesmanbacteria bacterium]